MICFAKANTLHQVIFCGVVIAGLHVPGNIQIFICKCQNTEWARQQSALVWPVRSVHKWPSLEKSPNPALGVVLQMLLSIKRFCCAVLCYVYFFQCSVAFVLFFVLLYCLMLYFAVWFFIFVVFCIYVVFSIRVVFCIFAVFCINVVFCMVVCFAWLLCLAWLLCFASVLCFE